MKKIVAASLISCAFGCGEGLQSSDRTLVRGAALSGPTGSMPDSREIFTATRLQNGKVLIAGGHNTTLFDTPSGHAALYDPAFGTFTATGSLNNGRYGHRAVALSNGKVHIIGGRDPNGSATITDELYDPATGTFAVSGSNISYYQGAAALLSDGRVLEVGGADNNGFSAAAARIYDPASNSHTSTGSMAVARCNFVAALLPNGQVLVAGGRDSAGNNLTSAELFDPTTGTWTAAAPMNAPRSIFAATLLPGGKVLVTGGVTTGDVSAQTAEIYDPEAGTWTTAGTLPNPRSGHVAALAPSGTVLLIGGWTTGETATVDSFDPTTGTGTSQPPMTSVRVNFAVADLQNGNLLIAGGSSGGTALATAELYQMPCTPTTCAAAGATCGTVADGCGGTLSCGSCGTGQTCSANHACVCQPTTCAAQGKTCGTIADGCGGVLACGSCGGGASCSANNVCVAQGNPQYDATRKMPVCQQAGPVCDSGSLLDGRAGLGPESNSPNTIASSCPDGTAGTYHSDESLDHLTVTSVDGTNLASGKTARIDAAVWVFSAPSDHLDLYSTPSVTTPAWTFIGTLNPTASGAQTLSTTYTLPAGSLQAVRGIFRYSGTASGPCVSGSYNDHDDLAFPVDTPIDTVAPTTTLTAPSAGATLSGTITLSATASDDSGVVKVDFLLDGSLLGSSSSAPYSLSWNTRAGSNGVHTLTSKAYDASGNTGVSSGVSVTLANDLTPPTASITSPVSGATVSGTVTLSATASDDVGVARVEFWDGATLLGSSTVPSGSTYSIAWNTTASANGSHSVFAKAYDTANNLGQSATVVVTVSNIVAGMAQYDAIRKAPACATQSATCDSGTLLNGRAGLGPEAHAPNTIGSTCADGASGTYHSDESLDRLKVSTTDGTPLAPGKTVRVEATIWAYSAYTSDHLDLYLAADATNPSWTFLGTLTPTMARANTLSTTFTLPSGPLQAIRGVFRYGGAAAPCTTGPYDDHDDLVFATQ